MSCKQPEQSLEFRLIDFVPFSELVKQLMSEKNFTPVMLIDKSNLSKTTISRILRNSNDKGGTYQPTESVITAISLAFGLNCTGQERLIFAAFPERIIWKYALEQHLSIDETNDLLVNKGFPSLGPYYG